MPFAHGVHTLNPASPERASYGSVLHNDLLQSGVQLR